MGWAFGVLNGREVGYGVTATCDRRGCDVEIDRGLGWRCGGAEFDLGCGRYYCAAHLRRHGPRGGCPHRGKLAWGHRTDGGPERPEEK